MSSLVVAVIAAWYFWYLLGDYVVADEFYDENRPYEFSFNIVNFQHRHEKKDADGIITGEYGFITADGVYHETAYATDKDGDFKITSMRNRKITSLGDAKTLFKDKPEVAKKLTDALLKSCSGCTIPEKKDDEISVMKTSVPKISKLNSLGPSERNMGNILKAMMKVLTNDNPNKLSVSSKATSSLQNIEKEKAKKNEATSKYLKVASADENPRTLKTSPTISKILEKMTDAAKKILSNEITESTKTGKALVTDKVLEKMANDLYYHFNYTITSHGHHEDGYRDGSKDGGYNTVDDNGIDIQVKYLSNEFGHQPNITLVPGPISDTADKEELKGYSFIWY